MRINWTKFLYMFAGFVLAASLVFAVVDSATLTRTNDPDIESGNTINADHLDAELDQLVNESNSQDTRLDTIETGNPTVTGQWTFSHASAPIKTDIILERTSTNGVSIDGVVLKDSKVNATVATPTLSEGEFVYDSDANTYKGHNGTSEISFLTSAGAWPTSYNNYYLYRPEWASTTTITIPDGLRVRDDSDACNIHFNGSETIDITTSTGAAVVNSLMNGLTESSNQYYYIWAIGKSDCSDEKGLLTTSSSTIATFPTDYSKKRLIGVVLNNSSSNFVKFKMLGNFYLYQDTLTYWNTTHTAGATNILSAGTSATWAAASASAYIPPESTMGYFHMYAMDAYTSVRTTGDSNESGASMAAGSGGETKDMWLRTDSSQSIDYIKRSGTSLYIDVAGFLWEAG